MIIMETIIQTQPSLEGVKLSQAIPFLEVIAHQNKLVLSKLSSFKKASRILLISICNN